MRDTNKKLYIFVTTLLVLSLFSIAIFGIKVLYMLIAAILSGAVFEVAFALVKKEKMNYIEWLVTPILFVMFLPVTVPIWLVISGTIFAVLFGKLLFGGAGKYVFSPALVGILFVTISFLPLMNNADFTANLLKAGSSIGTYKDLLLGNTNGMVGETFRLLIIGLGVVLILYKVIDWKIPFFYILSFFLITYLAKAFGMQGVSDPLDSLFVGTLMLGAFFAATDEATIAKYPIGRVIYAVGLGFFTFLIRTMSAYPEGVVFAIIIMNMLAPLIDKIEEPRKRISEPKVISEELI
ncbi:MAG TPA: RnfABCDGE type electron transport complex subunit D [Haploplasma sp.]|nr:RnfABCDGE type electron transport complex subunit D [Haploplasma sp.]